MDCCGRYHPPLRFTPNRGGRLMTLREGIGDDADDMLGLDLDTGDDDDEHTGHLADAARAIFANKALSAEAKLKKLRLLLKIGADEPADAGEPGPDLPDELRGEDVPECLRSTWRRWRRRPPVTRSNYDAMFPGLGALPGGVAIITEGRRLKKGGLSLQRFLEAIQRGH
jgi:hypothetical protein